MKWCLFTYMLLYVLLMVTHLAVFKLLSCDAYIDSFSCVNECMGIVSQIYHTCCVHFCIYLIFSSTSNKYSLIFLVSWTDLMQLSFWNSQPSDIIIRMAAFTTYQHCHTFSYRRNGSQVLFHVISPSMYLHHSEIQK